MSFAIYAAAAVYEATRDPEALDLAKRAYAWLETHAHDAKNGGFYDGGPAFGAATVTNKVWWTQAEGLNALLLMHTRYGNETPRYGAAFLKQWAFVSAHQIDPVNTGWLSSVSAEGVPVPGQVKSDAWKDPYHQGPALLNVSETLRKKASGL